MAQAPLPANWTLLAHGEQENDAINRCPAGHIHLDYGNVTIRFERDEFLAFAHMVTEAANRLTGNTARATAMPTALPPNNFSLN